MAEQRPFKSQDTDSNSVPPTTMRTPHTMVHKGKMVLVIMKSGESFEDRFVERTRNKHLVFEHRTVRLGDVKSFISSPKIRRAKVG